MRGLASNALFRARVCETERASDYLIKPPLIDASVYMLILFLGVLQFFLCRRASDFVSGDVTYYELARSLLEKGWYGYNLRPETMLPPGFAVIVAGIWVCFCNSYEIFIRSMAVFATLFLCSTYGLLRRELGQGPAAAICLLIGSSPIFFSFSTTVVLSDLPYAFTSTLALLVALRLDAATNRRARVAFGLSFGGLLACSLMLRSAAISLLAALVAWLTVSVFACIPDSKLRSRTFVPLLVFGIAIQALWMTWAVKHEKLQWPSVGGWPGSYASQIKLKNGNYPELGTASLVDHAVRVKDNVAARSAALLGLITRKWFDPVWNSPVVLGTVLLLLLGLRSSGWLDASGLIQWYFVFHEAMYILWPWELEIRFLLPVAPLACVYLWRGGHALVGLMRREPKTWTWAFGLSVIMALYSANLWIQHQQGKSATVYWVLLAACSACITGMRAPRGGALSLHFRPDVRRAATASVVGGLVLIGLFMQCRIGLDNLYFDVTKCNNYPDIEAGQWLEAHANPGAVVMARQEVLVQHCCGRKIVWFPPSSDPSVLMDGIRKHHVEWIVVTDRKDNYFSPPDPDCFAPLARAYPDAFHLVHRGPRYRIFQVKLTRENVYNARSQCFPGT